MKKTISLLLILCLTLALLAGCSGKTAAPADEQAGTTEAQTSQEAAAQEELAQTEPAAKKTMVIGDTTFNSENWEETVDPHRTYNGWACIRYGIGETLVHYTDSMELEPWLAKSWENDGNLTWTIVLQDNVTFSNGRAMDAAAVKQCFEHLLENHDRAPGDTKIADMQADGQVLTITTSEPNPALMNYLGDPYGCIIDVDASDFDAGVVVGTGPYVVKEMVTDDHLTLTKNETYWNGTPKIDELTIRTLSNGDTLSAALQAGDIDAAYGMAYEAYPNFENDSYQFSSIQTSRAFFGSMNMTSSIIQDPAVRKAIAMGIDKQGFVAALLDGHGVPANGAFPDGFAGFGGENITKEAADKRARLGMFLSFQNPLEVPGISLSNFIRSALSARTGKNIRIWDFNKDLQKAMEVLDMDPSYGFRDLNVGFSGGEKKKAEILQLLLLNPSLAILDETDSGLDVDAVRTVSKGIEEYQKSKDGALLIITHSTRILESLHVDKTHVLVDGRLVAEGDGSLVDEINENGFEQFIASANEKGENNE